MDSMAHINSKTDQGNGATLINKKAKIAINYPAISIQNASDWNTNYHE
ncbi:hypothetical protein [Secundilactobacillus silagei]|nr:hypothetical protein [Secundilactobacillus silagei]